MKNYQISKEPCKGRGAFFFINNVGWRNLFENLEKNKKDPQSFTILWCKQIAGCVGVLVFFYSNVNAFYQLSHFPVVFIKFRRFHGGIPGFPVEWEPCNKTKSMSMGNSLFFFGPVGKCDFRFWLSNAWEMTSILWEANSFPHVDFQN